MLNKMYIGFYLEGRNAKPMKHEADVESLAAKVLEGGDSPPKVAEFAALKAAEPYRGGRSSGAWIQKRSAGIAAAGGAGDEAYRHYMQGRVDELTGELDALICEALEGGDEDEDEDEEDGDGDEDEGDDGDDEEE